MEFKAASEFTATQLAECVTKCFKGYVAGDISFTGDSLVAYNTEYGMTPERGLVACQPGNPELVAFSFIGVRDVWPGLVRLGAFGVVPELKGQGVGYKLVEATINAERARGTKVIELECIRENPAGLRLYEKSGFTRYRDLKSWERDAPSAEELERLAAASEGAELQECTVDEVRSAVREYCDEDLPWQAWMLCAAATSKAYKVDGAWCVVSDPTSETADTIKLQSLITRPDARGKGQATKLASAVMAKFPGKKWAVTAHFPTEYVASIAKRLGFHEGKYAQYQMRYKME